MICFCITALGQTSFGIKAGFGGSYLSTKIDPKYIPNSTQKFYWRPITRHGGFFYNYQMKNKSLIGAEILFLRVEGKESIETIYKVQGNREAYSITTTIWRNFSYLSIPIYYGYAFKKIKLNMGLQTSINLYNAYYIERKSTLPMLFIQPDYFKMQVDRFNFGLSGSVLYNLTKKIALEAEYYYGLNNLLISNSKKETWKLQKATLGVRYNFSAKQ